MLTIAQKTIFFFHSLESSFDLQSNKKISVGHQPNPPCQNCTPHSLIHENGFKDMFNNPGGKVELIPELTHSIVPCQL